MPERNNSSTQIVETVGSDTTASSNSPTNMTIMNYQHYYKILSKTQKSTKDSVSPEDNSNSSRRHRGQSIYFDIDQQQQKKCGISRKLRPLIKSKFYRKKSSLNLISEQPQLANPIDELLTISEIHQNQKKASEKAWKASFYKYGYFKKSGKNDNEVSEIQEEPDEDYEENLSKILNKALDIGNPIQTEGIEVEEIGDSDINLFQGCRGHALSELEPSTQSKPPLGNLKMSMALRKIAKNNQGQQYHTPVLSNSIATTSIASASPKIQSNSKKTSKTSTPKGAAASKNIFKGQKVQNQK
ncbi:UNKNOWN [Stylonychia lemnae]|uniref:Uncharacterized protein n=1 Tax=Stylonychia lemnae TaxID=5949 RepID=A0A078AZZ0_STYLE|nr:UNKNOWN [Stylonychia lemnae]|eukprot:CDW86747.1 UNKNOWN [Stylonychia lemnae]